MTEIVRCVICDKKVRNTDPLMVHMRTDGRLFTQETDVPMTDADDQGWFPVGSECVKQVRAAGAEGFAL